MLTAVKNHMIAQAEMHLETLWRLIEAYPDNRKVKKAAKQFNDIHTLLTDDEEVDIAIYATAMAVAKDVYRLFNV